MELTRFDDSFDLRPRLLIKDAQPREHMAAELMEEIERGMPWMKVDGDVLTIWDDYGHRYIYRVGDLDPLTLTYELEWPD